MKTRPSKTVPVGEQMSSTPVVPNEPVVIAETEIQKHARLQAELQATEQAQREARIQADRRIRLGNEFSARHKADYADNDYNSKILIAAIGDREWSAELLDQVYLEQTRAGNLLPPPYQEPVKETKFDTGGLTYKAMRNLPRGEFNKLYNTARGRRIIDYLIEENAAGRS
jgi:hypothetical protein